MGARDQSAIRQELAALQQDGVIRPVDVVEFAKDPDTALHDCFEWDESKAAHEFRLEQARKLLRVFVTVDPVSNKSIRAFVSLTSDRKEPGGGYRATVDVLSDADMTRQMLSDALAELRVVQRKYKSLQALEKVWQSIDDASIKAKSDAA